MGSNFFRSGFGAELGQAASHSFMRNAPGVFRSFGMDPTGKIANKVATAPTPFAGRQPTLADASRGYGERKV
jgi:hypothetical protein